MRYRLLTALAGLLLALVSVQAGRGMLVPAGGGSIAAVTQPVPPAPPPPSSEPRSRWTNPPWKGLGIFVAWGFETGQFTPENLAALLAANHFDWAALEGSPENNEQYMVAFRDALHARGLKFGIWERTDRQKNYPESYVEHASRMISQYHPDFYGADAEVFPLDQPSFPHDIADRFPNLPRVWIPGGLPDAATAAPFVDNGFDVMPEDFAGNLGRDPVEGVTCSIDHDAYYRNVPRNAVPADSRWGQKWCEHGSGPHTWPIIEVHAENNPDLKTQLGAVSRWGRNFSIWNAEQMTDADWAVARSLG